MKWLAMLCAYPQRPRFRFSSGRIYRGAGDKPEDVIDVADIAMWQEDVDPWIFSIPILLRDGRVIEWGDSSDRQLETILRQVAPERCTVIHEVQ